MLAFEDLRWKPAQLWHNEGTFIVSRRAHLENGAHGAEYVDELCATYMSDTVDLNALIPCQVSGDGNCLLRALCVAIVGCDDNHVRLRADLVSELEENELWYRHFLPATHPWNETLDLARPDGSYLGSEHIWALANFLRRPIILLDSLEARARQGEGEGGVAATFLPTRHPIGPAIAPPLTISWTSSDHLHYVPLLPVLERNEPLPRVKLPHVAFPNSISPGTDVEDYFQYRVARNQVECSFKLIMDNDQRLVNVTLKAGYDVMERTFHMVKNYSLSRERIAPITSFMLEAAKAYAVPVYLGDSAWRILQDLNGVGIFPMRELAAPPVSSFTQMTDLMRAMLEEWEKKLDDRQTELMERLFATSEGQLAERGSEVAQAFTLLLDLLPFAPKPAILLGFLHCFLARTPIGIIYHIVKECCITQRLVDYVAPETPAHVMFVLLRCFATLLCPQFGLLSFPIIHHSQLRMQLRTLIKEVRRLHFGSVSAFLHNYAVFTSHTQLLSHRVRHYLINTLLHPFIERCKMEAAAGVVENDPLSCVTESLVIAVGNVVLAQPELAQETQEKVLPLIESLDPLLLKPALLSDLRLLLSHRPYTHAIPPMDLLETDHM